MRHRPKQLSVLAGENTHLNPGHSLLSLHHARCLGGLTLAHQLRGAEVARAEENAFDEHCRVTQQVCKRQRVS